MRPLKSPISGDHGPVVPRGPGLVPGAAVRGCRPLFRRLSNRPGRPGKRRAVGVLPVACLSACLLTAARAEPADAPSAPSADEVLASLALDPGERARVLAGEIVVVGLPSGRPNELAVGAAFLVDARPEVLLHLIESGRMLDADDAVQRLGSADPVTKRLEGLPGRAPAADASSEVHDLLRLKPGSRFNFSSAETGTLNAASKQARLGRSQRHPAVSAALEETRRTLLQERLRAYYEKGLPGIESYDRGEGESSSPAAELEAALQAEPLLRERLPRLFAGLEGAPALLEAPATQRFRWLEQRVQGRPQLSLIHQVAFRGDQLSAVVERQFFVAHTYNSLQTLTALLRVGDRTLVVHSNRTFTDAILGFAEGLAQRIGQGRLSDEVLDDASRLRALVAARPIEQATRGPSRHGGPAEARIR